MRQETVTVKLHKLYPSEGMVLTNGEQVATREVCLTKGDSASNWREVTPEEGERIKAEAEKRAAEAEETEE